MSEIYDYKCSNNIVSKNNGILWRTRIQAYDKLGDLLHDECKEFSFSINRYGQEEIIILWELPEQAMKRLNIRGNYNPCFQDFFFEDGTLIIEDKEVRIVIYPIIQ